MLESRLLPLLDWINVDTDLEERREQNERDYQPAMPILEVRRRLRAFVTSFDGRDGSLVRVGRVTSMLPSQWRARMQVPGLRQNLEPSEIAAIRVEELRFLLNGVLAGRIGVTSSLDISLDIDLGANTTNLMVIGGTLPDVVIYLAMYAMADGDFKLGTCIAPAAGQPGRPNDWGARCDRLHIVSGRGNLKRYCSERCKRRAKNPNWKEHLRKRTE